LTPRYKAYDNEEVHLETGRQVAVLIDVVASALSFSVILVLGAFLGLLPAVATAAGLLVAWLGIAAWTTYRLRKLRRIAWCVRVSQQRVVSYDYTRRATRLPWKRIRRVDLQSQALHLIGPAPQHIEVPHRFRNFADVSHTIVDHAEANEVPVHVDGQPWDTLDVYTLYPGLDQPPRF